MIAQKLKAGCVQQFHAARGPQNGVKNARERRIGIEKLAHNVRVGPSCQHADLDGPDLAVGQQGLEAIFQHR